MEELLKIQDLTVTYRTNTGLVTALDTVNVMVGKNELLSIVGESGCGKSTLGLSVIGLLPPKSANVTHGSIEYKGTDLVGLGQDEMREYRGTEIAMIFQEPLSSLNPVYRVGEQIAEAILLRRMRKEQREKIRSDLMEHPYTIDSISDSRFRSPSEIPHDLKSEIVKWLNLVRIADPEQVLERYPFELSGGMAQRVMIAMALSEDPALLIADEPTTALDVTTQAQVLRLMRELMDNVSTSVMLVTHDLAVASQVADRVVVMYAGEIVEDAEVHSLFSEPLHPYTMGLLLCIPSGTKSSSALSPIPGTIPDLRDASKACRFAPRCPRAFERCGSERPRLLSTKNGHKVACFLYDK